MSNKRRIIIIIREREVKDELEGNTVMNEKKMITGTKKEWKLMGDRE